MNTLNSLDSELYNEIRIHEAKIASDNYNVNSNRNTYGSSQNSYHSNHHNQRNL